MRTESKISGPYTNLQKRLHWVVALLIALQWWAGESMHSVMQVLETQKALGFGQFLVSTVHSFGGLVILALVLWRLRVKMLTRAATVPAINSTSPVFQRLARINHFCLYLLIGLMVLSGSLSYYQILPLAGVHGYCGMVLKILVFLHIAAALYHHFVRKDGVLTSMWFEKP